MSNQPEAGQNPEQEKIPKASGMRVYPLGFRSDVKRVITESDAKLDFGGDEEMSILGLLTEEEIAVVLAKVSRNPGGFLEIAKTVDEEGASQFHAKWVTSVEGYGHASVAEHAILHIAAENISSFAGDELTDNRLMSATEFSARFKGRQDVSYFTPESVTNNKPLAEKWHNVHQRLFALNDNLMELGVEYLNTDEAKDKVPGRRVTKKTVADQFKNLMPASRMTSIGITINAREAEHVITKFLSSQYPEVQELGQRLKEQSLKVAPTLVKYADRNDYLVLTREGIQFLVDKSDSSDVEYSSTPENKKTVKLLSYDEYAEESFIAAATYSESSGKNFSQLLAEAKGLSPEQKDEAFEKLLGNLGKHDIPIRMLEFAGDYRIEVPEMTYGDWREWKRHRMETYAAKDLSVDYGYMIPSLAFEMDESNDPKFHGAVDAIKSIMGEVEDLYDAVYQVDPQAAPYCVTRFHYRPAIVKMNVREAFHFISLRTGPTAHPFIRKLAWAFYDEVSEVHPLFAKHIGKRLFAEDRPPRSFNWTF